MLRNYCFGTLLVLAIPLSTNAAPIIVSYSATIEFDSSAAVGTGGQNAGNLIEELFGSGIGSGGSATLTGMFTYETTVPAFNSNNRSAGYVNAITGATATVGRSTVAADIGEIAANAATSEIGYNTNPSSGFCGVRETCAAAGLAFTPTGNRIQIINDSSFFLIQNGNRVNYSNRDAISLGIGFTDSDSNFFPLLSTPSFGDVNVHGLSLFLISDANRSFNDNVLLPDSASFVSSDEVETSILTMAISSPALTDNFTLTGQLTGFTTSPVPEPTTWAMLMSGLIFVVGWIRPNRRHALFA